MTAIASSTGLLSLAESQRRARPLCAWSAAQRRAVQARLLALLRDWCRDWGVPGPTAAPTGVPSPVPGTSPPDSLSDTQAQAELARTLWQTHGSSPLDAETTPVASHLVTLAWTDWLARLDSLLPPDGRTPATTASAQPANAWDGHLSLPLPWCGKTWCVMLAAPAVSRLVAAEDTPPPTAAGAAAATPPVALAQALAVRPLTVGVYLAPVALTLGQVQALRPGDIVPLPHALDQPARLLLHVAPDAPPEALCHAWLGQQDGHMAVELAPDTNPPSLLPTS